MHRKNILKNPFSNTAGKMKNLVSMNTPYMLVITRSLSLNGWIKKEYMQLIAFELAFTANVLRKKNSFSRRKTKEKRKTERPNKYNFQFIQA